MKKGLATLCGLLLVYSAFALNVIFLVGDGMSTNQLFLASILEGRILNIMTLPYTGLTTTYSADAWVTDSAPAGTALFAGFKALNRAIGVLPNNEVVYSAFEMAKRAGYKIGLAVTCQVTHATPAAVYAHVANRNDEVTIAKQLIDGDVVDVVLGGGWQWFLPESKGGVRKDGIDLIEIAKSKGYTYITTPRELENLSTASRKVLGLFAKNYLEPVSERPASQPTLDVMTKKAIEILSASGQPFMLMIEGSQIDWECHANDFYGTWKEVVEFDNAVKVALDFAKRDGNTLVIVVGDHETGGLSLSAGGYTINVEQARKAKGTTAMFLKQYDINNKDAFIKGIKEWYDITMSDAEYETLRKVPTNNLRRELARYVSFKVGFGWTTYDHTAQPVPVYAFGPGAHLFTGVMDNTDIAKTLMRITGVSSVTFPTVSSK
ncbi:MAG: alkaline phosphatase [Fervidobacterium sp.]|nr:alkaline phosphatase [Fervidobacterium sp.]